MASNSCLLVALFLVVNVFLNPVDGSFQDVRTVGFTARRTTGLTSGDSAIAGYDQVVTNRGDSFDPSTGKNYLLITLSHFSDES